MKKVENKALRVLIWALMALASSIVLSVLYYGLFALLLDTDVEKVLREENRVYRKVLPEVSSRLELLRREVDYLQDRDAYIYRTVFMSEAPKAGQTLPSDDLLSQNVQASRNMVRRAWESSGRAMQSARRAEDNFRCVLDSLFAKGSGALPPLSSPLKELPPTSVGASVGSRLSPFYKVPFPHDGLDIVAPQGESVLATAPGWVNVVKRSSSREGNVVEIIHYGGYVTRYTHLQTICVKRGTRVRPGTKIGTVGDSGRSFTTHLHYEVLLDGVPCDPLNHLFGSVGPEDYLKMLVMGASSGQSMD